jgi:hypothetical protein
MKRTQANQLNLGTWNKVKDIANQKNMKLFLVNTHRSFLPSENEWEEMHLELGGISVEDALRLTCRLATETKPDEMRYASTDGIRRLELWWD